MKKLERVQAFHFKGGQGAKTGTGGHLPGHKVQGKIAMVRGLEEGQAAISPPRFPEWSHEDDFRKFADEVREFTGGIPIGFKLSAQRVEEDLDAALRIGVDYVILDGRGGGTGAAPLIFRDNISVPTLPALARARKFMDERGCRDVSLVITGGLRTPADFAKALALGADAVGIGRPYVWGLGGFGEDGVDKVIDVIMDEFRMVMRQTRTTSIDQITSRFVMEGKNPVMTRRNELGFGL
jgi:glutamate synthase domain-containing protein 2